MGKRGNMKCLGWLTIGLSALLAGAVGGAWGQADAPPDQQPGPTTTFRVNARNVVLDVVVTDSKNNPVTNLTQKDFHVYETKTEQKIVSFSKPADHELAADAPPVKSAADLIKAGPVPINIIILDELNTAFEDTAFGRSSAQKYLSHQPEKLRQPTTVLSISDSGMRMIADYTQDRDALALAVKKHFPVYPFRLMKGGNSGPDAGDRLARCLGSLLAISQSVKGYKGRKTILWIGKGFPSLDTDDVNADKAKEALDATKLVTSALLESRTVLNIIDPTMTNSSSVDYSDPDFVSPDMLRDAVGANGTSLVPGDISFQDFAPATGGLAFYARNDVDRQIATAADDGALYYTVVYVPTDKSDDADKFRSIVVKVDNPALRVWTRTGYYLAHQIKPGEKPAAPAPRQLAFDLMTAAQSTVAYSGLQVTAEKEGDKYRVTILPLGMEYRTTKSGGAQAEVTVMEVAFGEKAKVLEHHVEEVVRPVKEEYAPVTFEVDSPAPKGTARVRLVVRDAASGHIGTVDLAH